MKSKHGKQTRKLKKTVGIYS